MNRPVVNRAVMNRPQDEMTVLNRPVMSRPVMKRPGIHRLCTYVCMYVSTLTQKPMYVSSPNLVRSEGQMSRSA